MDPRTNGAACDVLYESAITETNPDVRRQRLAEAERAILERAKVLYKRVASRLGVDASYVSRVARGERELKPTPHT
jgi:hypothetical protein